MALIRPEAQRVPFARSPLKLVVCQLQFDAILSINDAEFIAPFQEDLRNDYPTIGRVAGLDLVVGPAGVETKEAEPSGWLFTSADGAWAIVLAPNGVTVRTEQYTNFEELKERFLWALERCLERFRPGTRTRLGLRYVNRLAFEEATDLTAWRELVRPELLGLVASAEVADDAVVMHSLGQTRFAQDESQLLARYGYVPGVTIADVAGGEASPEAPSTNIELLLDFDHFDVRPQPAIEIQGVADELDRLHEDIHRLFHWCITEEAERRLGIGEPSTNVHTEAVR